MRADETKRIGGWAEWKKGEKKEKSKKKKEVLRLGVEKRAESEKGRFVGEERKRQKGLQWIEERKRKLGFGLGNKRRTRKSTEKRIAGCNFWVKADFRAPFQGVFSLPA